MSATAARPDPFRPAKRVAGQRQDVWCVYLLQHFGPEWNYILMVQQVNCQRSRCRFAGPADCEHGSRLLVSDTSFGGVGTKS
jgi:hypothetical protein